MWQDLVFLAGSVFSIVVLTPTLRDRMARVPLGTSAPSALIGTIYGVTFLSLGMTFSAAGSIAAGGMWALIAKYRTPNAPPNEPREETQNEHGGGRVRAQPPTAD